jgi:hypothetical protein
MQFGQHITVISNEPSADCFESIDFSYQQQLWGMTAYVIMSASATP